jgi:hypothetical protein
MSTESDEAPQPLPDRPNLRHLKDQAKDLLKAGKAASLAAARFQIARLYGFARPQLQRKHRSRDPAGTAGITPGPNS